MEYLCYQQMVMSSEIIGQNNNIKIDTIIRKVIADTPEEAVGKFILETNPIVAQKKLEPTVFMLEQLLQIT